jgi:DNA-binding NarL/FixJ family response regulator
MDYLDCYTALFNNNFTIPENVKNIGYSELVQNTINELPLGANARRLTPAEKEICIGLALGLSAKEIGKVRSASNRTIETQISNIKMKVGCRRLPPVLLSELVKNLD